MPESHLPRRDFLKQSAVTLGAAGAASLGTIPAAAQPPAETTDPAQSAARPKSYNAPYDGAHLNRLAFPMGGLGAGMICLEGTGALSHVSIRNRPDVFNAPCVFAAVSVKGLPDGARVLEGPVPGWKIFGARNAANGDEGASYGLPRYAAARFTTRFPFATVALTDPHMPVRAEVTGWSPFIPGEADNSSLPVAGLEYRLVNTSTRAI